MNFKYKFGVIEVIAMIVSTIIIVYLSKFFHQYEFVYEAEVLSVIFTVVSVLFGAVTGTVTVIASYILSMTVLNVEIDLIPFLAFIGLVIYVGHYSSVFGVRDGLFKKDQILLFLSVHGISLILVFMFFLPFIRFLLNRPNLYDMIFDGAITVLCMALIDIPLIALFLLISYLAGRRRNRNTETV